MFLLPVSSWTDQEARALWHMAISVQYFVASSVEILVRYFLSAGPATVSQSFSRLPASAQRPDTNWT